MTSNKLEKKHACQSIFLAYQHALLVLPDHPVTSRWWCDIVFITLWCFIYLFVCHVVLYIYSAIKKYS